MNSFLKEKVVDQKIDGQPMEEYIAGLLKNIDEQAIEKAACDMKIAALKQLNNRHKNIIDAQRVMIKQAELEKELNGMAEQA